MASRVRAFGIGYQGRSWPGFLALLKEHGIRIVVDTREDGRSRKPGFAAGTLARTLEGEGIRFVSLPTLGCSKDLRIRWQERGDFEMFATDYRDRLSRHRDDVHRLLELARSEPTLILCMERRAEDCHRQLLAEALEKAGLDVEELA